MKITDLRTQNLYSPLGIGTSSPRLSWKLSSDIKGDIQTAYRIVSARSENELLSGAFTADTGKVASDRNYAVKAPFTLFSRERAYWRVTVWDKNGDAFDSDITFCEAGILFPDKFVGKWITKGTKNVISQNEALSSNAPILSREFKADGADIISARLYVSGLGIFEAYCNGERLGDEYFAPGESDARDTVYYASYDITKLIKNRNAVSVILGNGQYRNHLIHRQKHRYYKTDDARGREESEGMFGELCLIADIVLTSADGTETRIGTDGSWRYIESPITENSWYGGEDYDARLEIGGWNDADPIIPRSKWEKAVLVSPEKAPRGELRGIEFEPIRIQKNDCIPSEKIKVQRLSEGDGYITYLVDMSRNGAGFPELTVKTDKIGAVIKMYPAEVDLFGGYDGHINQESCTQSASKWGDLIYDTYITKGTGHEVYSPRFCYHGYRYLEVTAPADIPLTNENFRGIILRTDNKKSGSFVTSDEVLNSINTITERSIESNMYHTFTDCPQIEKLGWIETPSLMFYSMSQTYDISPWIPKIIRDMKDAQYADGRIAAIAPEYFKIGGLYWDLNWNGSIIFTAKQYHEVYGDESIFESGNYGVMKRYMDYLERDIAEGNLIFRGQMAEWGEMTSYGRTPTVLVETTAYYGLSRAMEYIADVVGNDADKAHYAELSSRIREAFYANEECHNSEFLFGNGTQSSYGCTLYSGIAKECDIPEATRRLKERIAENGYHLTSGEVGLKQVFNSLAVAGESETVYKMVTNDTMPSYKYFLTKDQTTLPEYWNFEDLWGSVSRSRNHAMMGHVKEWFCRRLAGISPITPAYRNTAISPARVAGVDTVFCSVDTVHGNITVNIDYKNGLKMDITVPVGVTAHITLPEGYKSYAVDGKPKDSIPPLPSGKYSVTAV